MSGLALVLLLSTAPTPDTRSQQPPPPPPRAGRAATSVAAGAGKTAAGKTAAGKTAAPTKSTLTAFARGFDAYRAGDYGRAARALAGVLGKGLHNEDWALFILGESEFYEGAYAAARGRFERVARAAPAAAAGKGAGTGLLAEMARSRVADCLWMEGDSVRAAAAYSRTLKAAARPWVDRALAQFRVAEAAYTRAPDEARRQWLVIHRDFPSHPLADEALRRAAPPQTPEAPALVAPPERLRRAESLTRSRHWAEALDELATLADGDLTPAQRIERDYQLGMTKFQMRRDYAGAARLLLGVAPVLTGDRAASAAFHGARALSRVDRDDEAIAGYRKVVDQHRGSRYAAEAQYLAGWLEFNRGRFRESVPGLKATLDHFGKSAFADDASWCLAFAYYLLGETDKAATELDRYARMPTGTISVDERAARVSYWRARLAEKSGRTEEARAGYRALFRSDPVAYYGLLARARLAAAGEKLTASFPDAPVATEPPSRADADPALARARELLDAGMEVEAGWEAEKQEKTVLARLGAQQGLAALLDIYRRGANFQRAYQLAESRGGPALAAEPTGRARMFWEAAYPKAYGELVSRYGPPAGTPELLLFAIMRKESGFGPGVVSYADARGLLQMIPPTSAKVAAAAGLEFFPDQLFDPEINVRLGAAYIGALYEKFGRQLPLTAGAYNAGPRAMARWCQQHPAHPLDEFVELIAFTQTREYVKRVVGIYARYRYLYGPTPYELPLTVDTRHRLDGPDY